MINPNQDFKKKIKNFIYVNEKHRKNINILEFGVRQGRSTKMFLDMCKKNKGNLLSIDVDDYSKKFSDSNWTFVQCRDDDYNVVKKYLSNKLDIILIDSFHEPNHVVKLVYIYWKHLKINGSMYIDDISWLPYLKNSWRDHKYTENINRDTFNKILEIQLSNFNNINLTFNFSGSGMCRIVKLNNNKLVKPKLIKQRNYFVKKFFNQ